MILAAKRLILSQLGMLFMCLLVGTVLAVDLVYWLLRACGKAEAESPLPPAQQEIKTKTFTDRQGRTIHFLD